jgi:hypothetical protein
MICQASVEPLPALDEHAFIPIVIRALLAEQDRVAMQDALVMQTGPGLARGCPGHLMIGMMAIRCISLRQLEILT